MKFLRRYIPSPGSGKGIWGQIIGTITNQADLMALLNAKLSSASYKPPFNYHFADRVNPYMDESSTGYVQKAIIYYPGNTALGYTPDKIAIIAADTANNGSLEIRNLTASVSIVEIGIDSSTISILNSSAFTNALPNTPCMLEVSLKSATGEARLYSMQIYR